MAKRKKTNEDLPDENLENSNDSDSFGLPDIDYKPINRDESVSSESTSELTTPEPEQQDTVTKYNQAEEQPKEDSGYVYQAPADEKSKAPIIIGVVIAAVVVIAGFLIYNFVYKPKVEKERLEQLAKDEASKKAAEEARLAKERAEAERLKREAEEAAAKTKPVEGTIEILSGSTKRYYVVITSAVDADLNMDYAKKLSAKGVSSKIIPPFGKWKFNRLSIGDFETFALAQTSADAAKAEYGDGVWVIKY
jgi:cytoskeletal protein RodZ